MRLSSTLSLLLALPAVLAAQGKRPLTDADVMRLKQVGGVSMAPDGSRILYTISAWEHPAANPARGDTALCDKHDRRSHIWIVSSSGGDARQLTWGERGESQPQWSPDGRTIAFLAARGAGTGEEAARPHIHLMRTDGGEAWPITSVREGVSGYSWSNDGKRIAFVSRDSISRAEEARTRRRDDAKVFEGDVRLSHVWVVDVDSKQASEVAHGDFTIRGAPSWSPDGTKLAFDAGPTPMIRDERRDAYLVDIASRRIEKISAANDVESTPQFSPDGRQLAFTILPHEWKPNKDGLMPRTLRNARLAVYDLASRTTTDLAQPSFDVSAGQPRWSADGQHLWFLASDHVYQSVYDYDLASRKYTQVSKQQLIQQVSPSRDGSRMALVIDTPAWPSEVYVQDASNPTPKRLTTTNPWLADIALGDAEVVTWKSKDGSPVEGVLLLPVGYTKGQRVPLLVSAHGGPTGAHTNGFKASSSPGQTWAGRGWAVLYPNPRGSTGYGEKWMRANIQDWGGGDYRDIMTGADALIARGIADSTRMAFEGWSYGGYMTSWVVSQTGRFKAAMMGAGLPSLLSMYGTTDIPGYIGTFFNGTPQYDGSIVNPSIRFYLTRSAISYSDKVTTPLLILHGGNDERVPIGQPMEFYRALKDRGKTVELVFYPREGHGFQEYYHQLDRMKREYEWIARHTLGESGAKVSVVP
jgi:dipeptidyl aminopeptidase/acylaminoacyl peptidase